MGDELHQIREGRPISAVDRVHTTIHGHLSHLCQSRGLAVPAQPTLNQLFNACVKLRPSSGQLDPERMNSFASFGHLASSWMR